MRPVELHWLNDRCLGLRWEPRIASGINDAVLDAALRLRAKQFPGVVDIVPGFSSLAMYWQGRSPADRPAVQAQVLAALDGTGPIAAARSALAGPLRVPVRFDDEHGPDLAASAEALGMSREELVRRFCAPLYRVAMIGFSPGFPYLLGLDPDLALPRLLQPRSRVPAGSVAVGGAQAGIYPRESPGGWRLLGHTAIRLFDHHRAQPSLLEPGRTVRFHPADDTDPSGAEPDA